MPFHPLFSRLIAFHRMLHGIRYELLLGSLLCVFVLNMLFPSKIYGGIAQFLYLPFQLLAALALFETNRILLRVFLCCAAGLMFCRVAGFLLPFEFEPGLTGLYFAFFAGVTGELFRQLWRMSNENNMNDLYYDMYIWILYVFYCDIVPVSWVARNATILAALAGNMYSLVVISSIVSRAGSSSRR